MSPETDSLAKQRTFIHDLSSPITIAIGMVDAGINKINKGDDAEVVVDKLEKAMGALNKVAELLKDRRQILIGLDDSES